MTLQQQEQVLGIEKSKWLRRSYEELVTLIPEPFVEPLVYEVDQFGIHFIVELDLLEVQPDYVTVILDITGGVVSSRLLGLLKVKKGSGTSWKVYKDGRVEERGIERRR